MTKNRFRFSEFKGFVSLCLTKAYLPLSYFCAMRKPAIFLLTAMAIYMAGCNGPDKPADTGDPAKTGVASMGYSIIKSYPHDTSFFTEGLEFYNNTILESTGLNGQSRLVQYEPETGKLLKEVKMDPKYFGEGITVLHDTIYQLTYKESVVQVYTARDFKKVKELPYDNGEGWGMTNDGQRLIVTNGTSNLYFYEPGTFRLLSVLAITENGAPVVNPNELEYINGYIYANQWGMNYILKIDPKSGEVVGKMDLSDLVQRTPTDTRNNFLNGIAYNKATNKIYVTGKNWPTLYEVQFDH
jgi:glutamine cyclotransferase